MINSGYINESMHFNKYPELTNATYNNIDKDDLSIITSHLSKSDMNDPKRVYNELMKYRDSSSSCYHYAAYVAKLMDYYHIPYKCYSGVAVVKGSRSYDINYTEDQLDRLPNTHVWIISNNKYYESFNNSSDVKHLKVDKEFICK